MANIYSTRNQAPDCFKDILRNIVPSDVFVCCHKSTMKTLKIYRQQINGQLVKNCGIVELLARPCMAECKVTPDAKESKGQCNFAKMEK